MAAVAGGSDFSVDGTEINDLLFVPIYQIDGSPVFRVGRVLAFRASQEVYVSFNWPWFIDATDVLQPLPEIETCVFTTTNRHLEIWLPCDYLIKMSVKNYTMFLTHRRLRKTVLRAFRKAMTLYMRRKAVDVIKLVWLEKAYRYPDGIMYRRILEKYN